jgi:hypothetical protein
MSRSRDWMPQFNWPVFGPFLGIVATLLIVGLVVGVRLWPEGSADAPGALGTNPDQNDAPPERPGTGGPGPLLVPPAVQELKLHSLPGRVSGTPSVRRGPGTQYAAVHQLKDGEEVHVIACSPGCEWYRILSLSDAEAQLWLPAVFVTVNGRADALPVLTPQ